MIIFLFHSGDDDIHSDLSVKQEENNDILEPTSSGRKYIKKNIKKKKFKYFILLYNIQRPNVPTARLKKNHKL